eukprot:m.181257 g.181257  ORF g.181257 m.181257 type:complete len:383 (-) comp17441_c1_seq5:1221-2369(-)
MYDTRGKHTHMMLHQTLQRRNKNTRDLKVVGFTATPARGGRPRSAATDAAAGSCRQAAASAARRAPVCVWKMEEGPALLVGLGEHQQRIGQLRRHLGLAEPVVRAGVWQQVYAARQVLHQLAELLHVRHAHRVLVVQHVVQHLHGRVKVHIDLPAVLPVLNQVAAAVARQLRNKVAQPLDGAAQHQLRRQPLQHHAVRLVPLARRQQLLRQLLRARLAVQQRGVRGRRLVQPSLRHRQPLRQQRLGMCLPRALAETHAAPLQHRPHRRLARACLGNVHQHKDRPLPQPRLLQLRGESDIQLLFPRGRQPCMPERHEHLVQVPAQAQIHGVRRGRLWQERVQQAQAVATVQAQQVVADVQRRAVCCPRLAHRERRPAAWGEIK